MSKTDTGNAQSVLPPFNPRSIEVPGFTAATPNFSDGSSTPRAFLEEYLDAIDRLEPSVRAFVTLNQSDARKAADASTERYKAGRPLSPLDGCPVAVKDIIETADMPTQMNSPIFEGWRSGRDAACVYALRQGGAVVLGKTVTTEFAMAAAGPTGNPHDLRRTPGGSSSGAAASVAAGMAPVALGTQTAGSIIRPAAFCGVYGFKPSHAALNIGGIHPLSRSHDTLGTLAGNLADAWLVAHQIASVVGGTPPHPGMSGPTNLPEARAPSALIRLRTDGWAEIDDATVTAFETALDRVAAAGATIIDRSNNDDVARLEGAFNGVADTARTISTYERRWPFFEYAERHPGKFSAMAAERVAAASSISRAEYVQALDRQADIRRQVEALADTADGFITLATSGPAPLGREQTGNRSFQIFWTLTGAPCVTLPRLAVEWLPVGLQVLGFRENDAALMGLAHWVDGVMAD